MFYIDSHCHLNESRLYQEADRIIDSAYEAGVKTLLIVGWDFESSVQAVELASRRDGVYAAIGFHPENLDGVNEDAISRIVELASNKKVIAIGEIGLDYYWQSDEQTKIKQKEWFRRQLKLARDLDLPVSIHAREATQDVYGILKEIEVPRKGVLHCYSGSAEMLAEFCKLGYYFGFDGPITYKNAKEPKRSCLACPLDRILSETDSPYLPPTPHRGETNYPSYIPLIVEEMAKIHSKSSENIAMAIKDNFQKLFHVKL